MRHCFSPLLYCPLRDAGMKLTRKRMKRPIFSAYNFMQTWFFLAGVPGNSFGSVDVTSECNLRCDHCYFFEQNPVRQLSLAEWQARFEGMYRDGHRFFQCSWVGGEPLLRQDIIEAGRRLFRYNTVTTNGTIALPQWKDVSWYISVDGSRERHDALRNHPGLFDSVKKTIAQSNGLKITIAYCITPHNCDDIKASLDDWSRNPKVRNMVFSFYTPVQGLDDAFWPGWDQRDRILDRLTALKETYGDFIVNSNRALRLMKADTARSVTDNCPFAASSFALNSAGELKKPCMLGPKADCTRCGCVVPFYLASLTDRRSIIKDFSTSIAHGIKRLVS